VPGIPLGAGEVLLGKIVPAPAGVTRYPIGDSTGGVMNVTQYVKHYFDGDSTELSRLRQHKFEVAASTDYSLPGGDEIATHLVQFADASGALWYYDDERVAWSDDSRVTSTFEVPSTSDGIGFELSKVDSLGNRRSVMYEHVGNVVVVVNVYTTGQINQDSDIQRLQAQVAALG
jgi:hypothetical protein